MLFTVRILCVRRGRKGKKGKEDIVDEASEHGCRMLLSGNPWRRWIDGLWFVLLVPGIVSAAMYAFQVDIWA